MIDTHAHLDHVENVDAALEEAAEAGVEAVVAVGIHREANKRNLALKERIRRPKIYAALGLHPSEVETENLEENLSFIRAHIQVAAAVGEIGLDFWYKGVKKNEEKKQAQRDAYRCQLELAREFNLPVVIHSRGAWRDCLDMAREAGIKKAVFHWYSGPVDILEEILKAGYFISCTPSLSYSLPAQEAARHAPVEQTLIETDCPVYYRDADGKNGFAAQPKDVWKTLRLYAALKGLEEEHARIILNLNAAKMFGITPSPVSLTRGGE